LSEILHAIDVQEENRSTDAVKQVTTVLFIHKKE